MRNNIIFANDINAVCKQQTKNNNVMDGSADKKIQ